MQSDFDENLERLVMRSTNFIHECMKEPAKEKAVWADLVERYIRTAYRYGTEASQEPR